MGLSAVNKLVIDEVNYQFARRISYVASTGLSSDRAYLTNDLQTKPTSEF